METIKSLTARLGVNGRNLRAAAQRLGIQRTGRDYLLDDKQVAGVLHELSKSRGQPSLYDRARRRMYRILDDQDAIPAILRACESSKGELRWLINGSEESIRDTARIAKEASKK